MNKKIYLTLLFVFSFLAFYAQCPVQVQSSNILCFGQCNGTAMAFGSGGGPYQYSWIPSGQTTQSVTGLCAGSYTVVVVNAALCVGQATVVITQPTQLIASTTFVNASCPTCCDGSATGTPSGGTPAYTYVWMPGGMTTSSVSNLCAGTYTFCVTDANACTSCSSVTISFSSGISESNGITDMSISPVPAAENILVSFINKNSLETKISIANLLGEIIYTENAGYAKEFNKTIDISSLTKGIFFLKIETKNGSFTKKIMKI